MANPDTATTRRSSRAWNGEGLKALFDASRRSRPWTIGYRSVDEERLDGEAIVEGQLPQSLRGVFYRNGPARHELGGQRYAHRWDGDGMVQAIRFDRGKVSHRGRYVETCKHVVEREAQRFVATAFGTAIPGSGIDADALELANAANINVLPFEGDLLALWEAGPAYRLDPDSLKTRGVKAWSDSLRLAPFSAHPKIDADGTLWNFGADPVGGRLLLYQARSSQGLVASHMLSVEDLPPVHDFAVTPRFLIFLLPPLRLDKSELASGASFGEACHWMPGAAMRVLLIRKDDWHVTETSLPPGCLFHVAQAREQNDGRIVIDYMRADAPLSLLAGWTVMRGEYRHMPGARLTRAVIDPATGAATQEVIGGLEAEFPVAAGFGVTSSVLCIERTPDRPTDLPGFDQVALIDTESGTRQSFRYGDDWLVEEHVVARTAADGERWVIGLALDVPHERSVVTVFDRNSLSAGPVARAHLPYALPLGLHGCYVPDPPTTT